MRLLEDEEKETTVAQQWKRLARAGATGPSMAVEATEKRKLFNCCKEKF